VVRPTTSTSLPGAFAIDGPHLNSTGHNDVSDTFESSGNYSNEVGSYNNEVLVQATLVEPPPPEPELYTVYAEPLLPFREKYKWQLLGGFSVVIIAIIAVLAIMIPDAKRAESMTSIALETSNQTSTQMLGVPQRTALDWVLGPNNTHFDPTRDRKRIAQRYVLVTLYYSTGGGNWTQNGNILSKNDECNLHESVNCSQDGSVTTIQLENNNLQ